VSRARQVENAARGVFGLEGIGAHRGAQPLVSDIFGVSGRQMLAALIDGQRDPKALALLTRLRFAGSTGVKQWLGGHKIRINGVRMSIDSDLVRGAIYAPPPLRRLRLTVAPPGAIGPGGASLSALRLRVPWAIEH
jgi:hypothetical protein